MVKWYYYVGMILLLAAWRMWKARSFLYLQGANIEAMLGIDNGFWYKRLERYDRKREVR